MPTCTYCKQEKGQDEFPVQKGKARHGRCRDCERTRIGEHRKKLRSVIDLAKQVPCTDCGKNYPPYVMDFDHQGEKDTNVAKMFGACVSVERLRDEIAKCEVVCANCHRERTFGTGLASTYACTGQA